MNGSSVKSFYEDDAKVLPLVEKKWAEWIEEVKRMVPKDQLLIFEVKQGW